MESVPGKQNGVAADRSQAFSPALAVAEFQVQLLDMAVRPVGALGDPVDGRQAAHAGFPFKTVSTESRVAHQAALQSPSAARPGAVAGAKTVPALAGWLSSSPRPTRTPVR